MSDISAFVAHDERFKGLLGDSPVLEMLAENTRYPFAHEAGVFIQSTNELFITSNRFGDSLTAAPHQQRVQISKVTLNDDPSKTICEEIDSSSVPMGNGGVNYKDGILFCGQGLLDQPSGLYEMSATAPYKVQLLVSDFYGRPFNSVNDVIVHSVDESIWFTDPTYGSEQQYRPSPKLPSQLYRYDPQTKSTRAMADGFGHPNGLCFSPDEKTLYVTDTDRLHGGGTVHDDRASTM
jgi:gluconolactonase